MKIESIILLSRGLTDSQLIEMLAAAPELGPKVKHPPPETYWLISCPFYTQTSSPIIRFHTYVVAGSLDATHTQWEQWRISHVPCMRACITCGNVIQLHSVSDHRADPCTSPGKWITWWRDYEKNEGPGTPLYVIIRVGAVLFVPQGCKAMTCNSCRTKFCFSCLCGCRPNSTNLLCGGHVGECPLAPRQTSIPSPPV